jgi:hypothetical protein
MQAFFDYCFCRIGPSHRQRQHNLVFRAVGVTFDSYAQKYRSYWKRRCPFRGAQPPENVPFLNLHIKSGCRYTKDPTLRTYGYLSDTLTFDDFVLVSEEGRIDVLAGDAAAWVNAQFINERRGGTSFARIGKRPRGNPLQ